MSKPLVVDRAGAMAALFVALSFVEMSAAESPRQAVTGPLVAYAWSGEREPFPNIVPMYWLHNRRDLNDPSLAKAATDALPRGRRVLFLWEFTRDIHVHPDDYCRDRAGKLTDVRGIWWDHGVERIAGRLDAWFSAFKQQGGQVDVVVLDNEVGLSNWTFGREPARWEAITEDPRFDDVAEQLGFRDLSLVRNWRQGSHYHHWNDLMKQRQADAFTRAVYDPIRRHFPDVAFSNYSYYASDPQHICPDINGHWSDEVGGDHTVGTHQSLPLYGWVGQLQRFRLVDGRFLRSGRGPQYGDSAFAGFRLAINQMRAAVLSSNTPVRPWVSHKRFRESRVRDADLYQELLFHTVLAGADGLLLWNPRPHRADLDPDHYSDEKQEQLLSDCLTRLDELLGDGPRRTLVEHLARWDGDHVLTGMLTDRGTLWRITPELQDGQLIREVLVSEDPPRFRTQQSDIRFPGGRLVRLDPPLSTCGWWVAAPADARPESLPLVAGN